MAVGRQEVYDTFGGTAPLILKKPWLVRHSARSSIQRGIGKTWSALAAVPKRPGDCAQRKDLSSAEAHGAPHIT